MEDSVLIFCAILGMMLLTWIRFSYTLVVLFVLFSIQVMISLHYI